MHDLLVIVDFIRDFFLNEKKLDGARKISDYVGELINARFSIRLWDGSMIPLGNNVDTEFFIAINGPGVIGALLRRPTYENLFLQYVNGYVGIHGDLLDLVSLAREKRPKKKLKKNKQIFFTQTSLTALIVFFQKNKQSTLSA